ncbi:MAG: TadE/TadG family type IV pilus assembly protein [Acidimicrobiales bacterium]
MVEFALVFTLLAFLLYGLITFGMILAVKQGVTNAASEGARAAIGASDPVATADARARSALSWLGPEKVAAANFAVATAPCVGGSGPTCVTVTITYPYAEQPLVPPAPGLGLVTPDQFSSSASVQIGA